MEHLVDAKRAYVAGNPTPEQLEMLEKEKAGEEALRKREELKKQGYLYKGKEWLFGGLSKDQVTDGERGLPDVGGERPGGVLEAVNAKRMEDEAAAATATERQLSTPLAEKLDPSAANTEADAKRSWSSWITRR